MLGEANLFFRRRLFSRAGFTRFRLLFSAGIGSFIRLLRLWRFACLALFRLGRQIDRSRASIAFLFRDRDARNDGRTFRIACQIERAIAVIGNNVQPDRRATVLMVENFFHGDAMQDDGADQNTTLNSTDFAVLSPPAEATAVETRM